MVEPADQRLLRAALGSRAGQPRFLPAADYDGDGLISYRDLQRWSAYWRAADH